MPEEPDMTKELFDRSAPTQPLVEVEYMPILEGAVFPSKGTPGASGYDVAIPVGVPLDQIIETVESCPRRDGTHRQPHVEPPNSGEHDLWPGEAVIIHLGFAVWVKDPRWEIQIRPRSGLAVKHGLRVPNSPVTVDSDYQGQIVLGLRNDSGTVFRLSSGMRVAQMVFCEVAHPELKAVTRFSEQTERGSGRFGSTGTHTGRVDTRGPNEANGPKGKNE